MRIVGQRSDGALHVNIGGGFSVLMLGGLATKPMDPSEIEPLGPWHEPDNSLDARREAEKQLAKTRVVPIETLKHVHLSMLSTEHRDRLSRALHLVAAPEAAVTIPPNGIGEDWLVFRLGDEYFGLTYDIDDEGTVEFDDPPVEVTPDWEGLTEEAADGISLGFVHSNLIRSRLATSSRKKKEAERSPEEQAARAAARERLDDRAREADAKKAAAHQEAWDKHQASPEGKAEFAAILEKAKKDDAAWKAQKEKEAEKEAHPDEGGKSIFESLAKGIGGLFKKKDKGAAKEKGSSGGGGGGGNPNHDDSSGQFTHASATKHLAFPFAKKKADPEAVEEESVEEPADPAEGVETPTAKKTDKKAVKDANVIAVPAGKAKVEKTVVTEAPDADAPFVEKDKVVKTEDDEDTVTLAKTPWFKKFMASKKTKAKR